MLRGPTAPFIVCAALQAVIAAILAGCNKTLESNHMLLWANLNLNAIAVFILIERRK